MYRVQITIITAMFFLQKIIIKADHIDTRTILESAYETQCTNYASSDILTVESFFVTFISSI